MDMRNNIKRTALTTIPAFKIISVTESVARRAVADRELSEANKSKHVEIRVILMITIFFWSNLVILPIIVRPIVEMKFCFEW